jgi:hypothetical protein
MLNAIAEHERGRERDGRPAKTLRCSAIDG